MLIQMPGFPVTLQRKKIKNINLRIRRTGEVQISAPLKTPVAAIHGFLEAKASWIETHRARLLALVQETPPALIQDACIYFLGVKYPLKFQETENNQRIVLGENHMHFFVRAGASQSAKELLLSRWYRSQMENSAGLLFDKWQSIMKVSINRVSFRRMTSRWGSCHPVKKQITINLRLIEKPLICLEYVIVHELVHLFEASHNQRFYALMSHYLPDWKQIKKLLV